MRRLLGLAVIITFSLAPFSGFAADTKSTDQPNNNQSKNNSSSQQRTNQNNSKQSPQKRNIKKIPQRLLRNNLSKKHLS